MNPQPQGAGRPRSLPAEKLAYGPQEAAKAIGVGKSTIWRYIAAGQLPTIKLGARTLIRREALEDLLNRAEAA